MIASRVQDKIKRVNSKNIPEAIGFLTPGERAEIEKLKEQREVLQTENNSLTENSIVSVLSIIFTNFSNLFLLILYIFLLLFNS